jgi:hypothetical protein
MSDHEPRCSFCGKPGADAARLIAGPGVYICEHCVGACDDILSREGVISGEARIPVWESMTDDAILEHLPRIAAVSTQTEGGLRSGVTEARRRGTPWAKIGSTLGMTRQSAWERFSGEE